MIQVDFDPICIPSSRFLNDNKGSPVGEEERERVNATIEGEEGRKEGRMKVSIEDDQRALPPHRESRLPLEIPFL